MLIKPTPEARRAPAGPAERSPASTTARPRLVWVICLACLAAVGLVAGFWAYRWLAQAPTDFDALRAQAEQDFLAGRYDNVAAAIERLGRQSRLSPLDYLLRARYAAARHEPDAALADLEQVPDDHDAASKARLLAGQIELRRDRVRRAEEWFQKAIRLDSGLVQAHRELIYIYGMQLRRAELSAQFLALSQLVPLTSDNVFHWCLLRNNSWEPGEAVATLDRYISADPADRWSRIALAENYRRMGQTDSAESVLEPLAPDDSEALIIRAQIAIDRQEQDRAERLLASGKKDDASLARLRGRMALSNRDARSAIHHFRVAFGADPDDRETVFGLACALELAHESKAAEPFRELAGHLERLNTLVHRAANVNARNEPGLLRQLGDACAALHRAPEARAWYELAIARDPLDSASQRALFRLREPERSTVPAAGLLPGPGSHTSWHFVAVSTHHRQGRLQSMSE
jgi:tetratricopeptide (TPR) repeat protein